MKNICIVTPSKNAISETFIQAHFTNLKGNIFILNGQFPDLYYNNKRIQLFYRKNRLAYRLKRLLPHFLYEKYIVPLENSAATREDYITSFLKTHKINVILAEYGHSGALILPYAKKLNIPLMVHFHGMDANHSWYLDRYMERYKQMFKYAFATISVSEVMHQQLLSYGANPDKTFLIPYGPRDYFDKIQPAYEDLFISIGRFADTKAPYMTVLAFNEVVKQYPKARLLYYGDGILRETAINLAKSLGIADAITFPGAVGHNEILEELGKACCYVQHSITTTTGEMEGTPNSILEAQAASLPVISTRHAGISQAVVHGETGYLVEELDFKEMGKYMLTLIRDKATCKQMGLNAKNHIRKNYSFGKYIQSLQEIVDNA